MIVFPVPIPAQNFRGIKPMAFRLKILLTMLNPHWVLESQFRRWIGSEKRRWHSSVRITAVKDENGKLIAYKKQINHGVFIREWRREVSNGKS